jgi:hypothetical protein
MPYAPKWEQQENERERERELCTLNLFYVKIGHMN